MGVRIEAVNGAKLKLGGDIETVIDLPFRAVREGFTLAFSDGTLVRGDLDYGTQSCTFRVEVEGAAELKIVRAGASETLEVCWPVEWISIAAGDDTVLANTTDGDADWGQLVLGIEQREAA
jgi:hypothetical protein